MLYDQLIPLLRQSGWAAFEAEVLQTSELGRRLRSEPDNLQEARRLAMALQVLATVRYLPQRPPAGQALAPALQARLELHSGRTTVPAFLNTLRESLLDLRGQYSYLLLPVKRLAVRLKAAGEDAGCDPFVKAVRQVAPESALWRGYEETRARLEERVQAAGLLLREVAPDSLDELLCHISSVIKSVELAYVCAGLFVDPSPREALGELRPLEREDNQLDRLNRAYYRLRGADIYEDFVTAVSHDKLQARADAYWFRNDLRRLQASDGPITVLEVGVGGGQYAADFLEECQKLGGEWSSLPFYERLTYVMGDISPAMLRDALERSGRTQKVEVVGLDELSSRGPYALQRYNELFDDLQECSILYVDPAGQVHRAELCGTFPAGLLPEGVKTTDLASWLEEAWLEPLGMLGVDQLALIDWEVRFVPCQLSELPGGELLDPAELPRDHLIPLNGGGVKFLRQALERAGRGSLRIFDYGLGSLQESAGDYAQANQIVRRYGASATRDVLFPLLERVVKAVGRRVRLLRLEEFIAEAMGESPLAFRFLMGIEGGNLVSQVASGPQSPFPLQALRHYEQIAALECSSYPDWIAELERRGWLRLGQPPCDGPGSPLERLGLDLDFAVSSVFRSLCESMLASDVTWLTGAQARAEVKVLLERVGYRGEAVESALLHPSWGKFWVLAVEAE